VGRTSYAIRMPTALWFAKYMIMPVSWLFVVFGIVANRLWLGTREAYHRSSAWIVAAVAFGLWIGISDQLWERVLAPGTLAYSSRGRWGNVANARARSADYLMVMTDLEAIARHTGSNSIVLPEPSAWGGEFFRLHGSLEWGSDYTQTGVTYLFWDLPCATPRLHLDGSWASVNAITPDYHEYLQRFQWLRSGDSQAKSGSDLSTSIQRKTAAAAPNF
jgi:hypothetical protein